MRITTPVRRRYRLHRKEAFDALHRVTELPLLILALAIIPLLLIPLLFDLSPAAERIVTILDLIVWAVFAFELVAKTFLAPSRAAYLRRNWHDVAIVALPFLQPLRVLRSLRLLRLVKVARLAGYAARAQRTLASLLEMHGLKYALLLAAVVILSCSVLVLLVERDNQGITNFGDALWWAFVTITTVGYGDTVPTTMAGRVVAVVLMFVGITVFSLVTANIATLLVRKEQLDEGEPKLSELLAELRQLRAQVDELTAGSARPDAPG